MKCKLVFLNDDRLEKEFEKVEPKHTDASKYYEVVRILRKRRREGRKETKNISDSENNHKFLCRTICKAESRATERI